MPPGQRGNVSEALDCRVVATDQAELSEAGEAGLPALVVEVVVVA